MRISDWSSDVCSSDLWSEFSPWLSKNPPAITIDLPVVLIALRLHAIGYPLIDGRKTIAYLHFLQRIEVDHHDTARARGEVAAVSIRADMLREARVVAEAEGVGFCRRNDEASAVQLDAGAAKPVIRLQGQDRSKVGADGERSEEHTSELQSLMRISYAVFCLKKKKTKTIKQHI